MTTRREGLHPHLALFDARDWGLVIYDEVHLLPAPIFRMTAELQARRRLGLTATLVREDGREGDVFSLIGPKRYDAPVEGHRGAGLDRPGRLHRGPRDAGRGPADPYAIGRARGAVPAGRAHRREDRRSLEQLMAQHAGEPTLVIGQYLDQLRRGRRATSTRRSSPGDTPVRERERLYEAFRTGEIEVLVVSKVANFSIDLPEANVAIQVSGAFGSRQEEAQRLGRILRPKADGATARFYTVVTRDTVDADFAANRQRFLAEQGYAYDIIDAVDL